VNLLHLDLSNQTVRLKARNDEWIGGRRLTSELVAAHLDPGCDPLSADNTLVWATGPLAGWRISCGDRLSLGGKSPLTGGIKESNSGGEVAGTLAGLDLRALVLSGAFPAGSPGLLVIDGPEVVCFLPANDYWGLRLEALAARLKADFGEDYALIAGRPLPLPGPGRIGSRDGQQGAEGSLDPQLACDGQPPPAPCRRRLQRGRARLSPGGH
jgi:aldehyde:ferredoxin oxidoreductase